MKSNKSITAKILTITLLAVILMAVGFVSVMSYFMFSLSDTILLNLLQPMAKTAAQDVEGNLHTLADRFFLIRDNSVFTSPDATKRDKQAVLDQALSGIEFVWLGIYETDGSLLTGSDECPYSISGRSLWPFVKETANLAIEDTSIGNNGLEIVMGIPMMDTRLSADGTSTESFVAYYLVGSYKYDVISDVLGNINIGEHGTAFIINDTGRIIAHKDLGKVFSRESIANNYGSGEDIQAALLLMMQGQTGSSRILGPEGEMFISYAPIRGTRWSLGIQSLRSDFVYEVQRATFVSVLLTIVIILLFSVAFVVFFRKILTIPLHAITGNARKLAVGQFEDRLPSTLTRRADEIGQLGTAFCTMSNTVQSVIGDIGRLTSAARTGSLEERASLSEHQGDYRLIIAGINATLDVFCSHLDFMPGALALLNESGQPVYKNRAMEAFLQRHTSLSEDGKLLASILATSTSGALASEVQQLFGAEGKSGDTYETNIVISGQNEEVLNYTLSLRRIGDNLGMLETGDVETVCVMLILIDVTQLTRAKIEAEMASQAKSDFLSNMSHEMRTPMNAIIGMTNIAMAPANSDRKDYCLSKINDASIHLLGVINDILDMSKIEANKFLLSYTEFNFEKMLQKVVNVVNFRIEEKQQHFTVYVDHKIPPNIIGDDQRLAQVITNLLANAVKFTPEHGSVRLETHFVSEVDGVCTIRFDVSDTGVGITQEQQSRLFTSFEQADSGISRKFGGTGLGLAISKRIVEMMGGRIWVESEQGKGSNFSFTIQAERAVMTQESLLSPDVNWSNIRILVVDDAPVIREYFVEIMGRSGITCDTALSGEDACRMIERNGTYDIYFIDWKMPGMNGIELTRRIRSLSTGKSVVIMISVVEWGMIEQEAKNAGVDRFLPKPLFPSSIIDCINDCLGVNSLPTKSDVQPEEAECFRGYRVILAEDVEINREIVLTLLEPTELAIDCAENGMEAVRLFSEAPEKYDMIFMDVQMPEMDGYEATRRIRALDNPHAQQIPIIAMTANVFREDIERCLASGMNDHVGKPLDFDNVFVKLHKYLPKRE